VRYRAAPLRTAPDVLTGFGLGRDRCRDRVPPTGGGEAISHSAPFQGRIYFYASQLAHGGQARPFRVASNYLHNFHQGRLSGAVSAAWAVCSSTWSSWTSRWNSWTSLRRASSSSAWAWTWAWRMVTKAAVLPSWSLTGWLSGWSSTSQRYPWGVGSLWASSSPLPMRRRIVSVETPKRRAASPIDILSTIFLLFGLGNSIGVYLSNRLGAAWVIARRFCPGTMPQAVDLQGTESLELSLPPVGPPSQRRKHGRPAGRRWVQPW